MYCKSCGHASPDGSVYCAKCGSALAADFELPAIVKSETVVDVASPEAVERAQAARDRFATEWPQNWEFDEELWRRAIGPRNTDYYLLHFHAIHNGDEKGHWNWPAFLFTLPWLFHRKMWAQAVVYGLWQLVFLYWLELAVHRGVASAIRLWDYGMPFLFATLTIGIPVRATKVYYRHLDSLITREKRKSNSRAVVLARVEKLGGAGRAGIIEATIVIVAAALLVLHWQGRWRYLSDRKMTEAAVVQAQMAEQRLIGYIQLHHRLPNSVSAIGAGDGFANYISSSSLDPISGVLTFDVRFGRHFVFGRGLPDGRVHGSPDGHVYFRPDRTDWLSPSVRWTCSSDERLRDYMPVECRP